MRRLALVAILGLVGCPPPVPSTCRIDDDCGGEVCTRVGVCTDVPTALRVSWTIAGAPADAATCAAAGIGELEVAIADRTTGDRHGLRPVPCAPGSFFFDKLPPSYRQVAVTAFSPAGQFLTSAAVDAAAGMTTVTIDLRPR